MAWLRDFRLLRATIASRVSSVSLPQTMPIRFGELLYGMRTASAFSRMILIRAWLMFPWAIFSMATRAEAGTWNTVVDGIGGSNYVRV